ncbi:PQQ-dependent sugar dehydrogenase [Verrucomicrobiota bacterium sgz303538]
MNRFPSFPLISACALALAAAAAHAVVEPPPDYRFKVDVLAEGVPQPMQLQIAPDGRIFFIEIKGTLRIYKPQAKEIIEAGALEVTTAQENGLLGMALDPDFAKNGWIYLLRSPKDEVFKGQVLSRFTVTGDKLDLASEKELLRYEEQRRECCHHAGGLRFGPDGLLYISAGDNTNPFASDGFSPHDERPDRSPWDAQKSAANTNDLRGKILRIKPTPDGKYTIPEGNLFSKNGKQGRPEIYVMGCRNPWRFNIDPVSNILYYGDVGPDSGSPKENRGPAGHDEINQVRKAGFFGWPYFIGDNKPYSRYDFAAAQSGAPFDPQHPENKSPNNTGAKILPPAQPAWIFYPAGQSREFPMLGTGGRTACAGPVFHWKAEFEKTGGLPRAFDNCLLIYDWSRPYVKWVRLDENSNRVGIEEFTKAWKPKRPVDMVIGQDGCLYAFDYGETWGENKDSQLVRLSYQYGNLAPTAVAGAKNATGREPLTVELSAEGSKDHDGQIARYEWRVLNEAGNVAAQVEFPGDRNGVQGKVTLTQPGNYRAELRVTDNQGATATTFVPIIVGNAAPKVSFEAPLDGDFFTPGQPINWKVAVADTEDGLSSQQPDTFAARTLVSANWERVDGKGDELAQGLTLMKASDCFNCHSVDQPLVGPKLIDVANKYRNQPGALAITVDRVVKGSTGVWGQVGMLPHPQHSPDEIAHMVRWIFSLEPGKGTPSMIRGLAGQLAAPKDDKISGCTIEATYADLGRAPAGSLAGKAVLHLRPRRIEADMNDGLDGPTKLSSGGCTGKYCLGAIADKHNVRFANINLAGTQSVTFRASSGNVGGKIELRAGSPTGRLLGSVDIPNTGGWDKWIEQTTALTLPSGPTRTDVYAVFVNPGKGGLMNLDWLQFNGQ